MPDTGDIMTESRLASAAPLPPKRSPRTLLLSGLAALVVLGAVIWGLYYLLVSSHYVSTDDAYVGADTAEITPLISGQVIGTPRCGRRGNRSQGRQGGPGPGRTPSARLFRQ